MSKKTFNFSKIFYPWSGGVKITKITRETIPNHVKFKKEKRHLNDGYFVVKAIRHPFAQKSGYVLEHRLIMERYLRSKIKKIPFVKRFLIKINEKWYLHPEIVVHHKNKITTCNKIGNLRIFRTNGEHTIFHSKNKLNKSIEELYEEILVKNGIK